jgi:hypothetical protein
VKSWPLRLSYRSHFSGYPSCCQTLYHLLRGAPKSFVFGCVSSYWLCVAVVFVPHRVVFCIMRLPMHCILMMFAVCGTCRAWQTPQVAHASACATGCGRTRCGWHTLCLVHTEAGATTCMWWHTPRIGLLTVLRNLGCV